MVMSASDSSKAAIARYEIKKAKLLQEYRFLLNNKNVNLGLHKSTSNLFRNREAVKHKLNVRDFNNIISVDPQQLIAEIEGMTTYEKIVKETLKYDCLPTVVPELKSITIGGALSGGGIEASSFRYGLAHETMLEYEVLVGDGRIINCIPENEHQDLYYGFPNTYGTLGYALKIKVKLIPAKKYIKIIHHHFDNITEYFQKLKQVCLDSRDSKSTISYIDGVVFDKNNLYITLGEFVDEVPYVSSYKYLDIYYLSIKNKKTDYMVTEDFIWRWDADWFWCSKNFGMENFIMRLIFGKLALHSTFFWKVRNFFNQNKLARTILEYLQGTKESVIQDVQIPIENAEQFLHFLIQEIGILPIWVCPTMPFGIKQYYFYKMNDNTLYINFGFWDAISSDFPQGYFNKKIEKKVQQLLGHKSLYSNVYYTETEFWKIYDKSLYENLKNKYDPNSKLKNLYRKSTEKNV